jgi:hypothetical protein
MFKPLFILILSLPVVAAAAQLPQVADFSQGRWDLAGGSQRSEGLSLDWGRDAEGAYLQVSGAGGSLTLPLLPGGENLGGPVLDLQAQPYSHSLVLAWFAPAAGARLNVCVRDDQGTLRCGLLQARQAGWQESSVAFPGGHGDANLPGAPEAGLRAGSVVLRPLDDGAVYGLRELRLDPPAESVTADRAAEVFGGSPAQVRALRRLGLPESLVWILQPVLQGCGCDAADLGRERATKSWGEITQGHGLAWRDAVDRMESRRAAAGLDSPPATPWQQERSWANRDLSGVRP